MFHIHPIGQTRQLHRFINAIRVFFCSCTVDWPFRRVISLLVFFVELILPVKSDIVDVVFLRQQWQTEKAEEPYSEKPFFHTLLYI